MTIDHTDSSSGQAILRQAAIVCREIALEHAPILYAERSEPQDAADSGWQFLCGAKSEDWRPAKVWAVHEVLEYDVTLSANIELPVGTVLTRSKKEDNWQVAQKS